jgi:site-specific recombinase XerD
LCPITTFDADGTNEKREKSGARVDRAKLRQIDLHWRDLRHEGACRLLADGVDIRIIHLILGHASVQQTQRYLNVTDEELRKGLEVSWRRRTLQAVSARLNA